jgi:hypothetical protein
VGENRKETDDFTSDHGNKQSVTNKKGKSDVRWKYDNIISNNQVFFAWLFEGSDTRNAKGDFAASYGNGRKR